MRASEPPLPAENRLTGLKVVVAVGQRPCRLRWVAGYRDCLCGSSERRAERLWVRFSLPAAPAHFSCCGRFSDVARGAAFRMDAGARLGVARPVAR
jgi:hypothetical protein